MLDKDDPKYVVVTAATPERMLTEASQLMEQGYVPHGPLIVKTDQIKETANGSKIHYHKYIQAMIAGSH